MSHAQAFYYILTKLAIIYIILNLMKRALIKVERKITATLSCCQFAYLKNQLKQNYLKFHDAIVSNESAKNIM